MSISGWFEKRREHHREKQIQYHRKHIKTKFGQGEDRFKAMDFFYDLGGKTGALGLRERFMVNVEPSIRDEEEKEKDEVEYMEITDTKRGNSLGLPVDETALENYIKSCINGEMLLMEEVPLMILRHCMDANMGWIKGFEKRTIEVKTVFLKKSKGKKVTIHVTLERSSTNL